MNGPPTTDPPRVAVIGAGLAGMAAALALRSAGCRVTVLEARRYLGGRAASFRDPASGDWVDLCQHVSMGCCTNLADFCRRAAIGHLFRREPVLHFFAPDGRRCDLGAAAGWPAPLHLAPALWGLKYLSAGDRLRIGWALWRLARDVPAPGEPEPTIGRWLKDAGQSPAAIEQFWSVVLVSALGESLDRASLSAARKVFVDGFMASREAYVVEMPRVPLSEIYDVALRRSFDEQGITLHTETAVREIELSAAGRIRITPAAANLATADLAAAEWDGAALAAAWRHVGALLGPQLKARLGQLDDVDRLQASPISGVHLWFDRPITELAHAVLVGRVGQWMFQRGGCPDPREPAAANSAPPATYYYQVVISASRALGDIGHEETIRTVTGELCDLFPAARAARLVRGRVVTDPHAVFSVQPGSERFRPPQRTGVAGLALAGDWTQTGWPATMEGAVRSGYLAAEAVLADLGRPARFVCPDLPRARLARWLLR